jgi:hypothetical protein
VKIGLPAAMATALAILLPSSGSAQSPPPCEASQTAAVQVTTRDVVHRADEAPLYATHEVKLSAAVQGGASGVQLTPQAGVRVLKPGKDGRGVDVVVPAPPSLAITVSWQQPNGTTQCSASKTITLPVHRAKPPTVRFRGLRGNLAVANVTFEVNPARTGESLSPIVVTVRKSARAQLPSSHARAFRFSVPMRPGDRRRYAKRLPAFTESLGQARACRYWYLTCGAVSSRVEAMSFPGTLSPRQPSRWAAPSGILVVTNEGPGPSPRRFGFDVQARQDGRLIAHYQRAGVCHDTPGPAGTHRESCQATAIKSFPR